MHPSMMLQVRESGGDSTRQPLYDNYHVNGGSQNAPPQKESAIPVSFCNDMQTVHCAVYSLHDEGTGSYRIHSSASYSICDTGCNMAQSPVRSMLLGSRLTEVLQKSGSRGVIVVPQDSTVDSALQVTPAQFSVGI